MKKSMLQMLDERMAFLKAGNMPSDEERKVTRETTEKLLAGAPGKSAAELNRVSQFRFQMYDLDGKLLWSLDSEAPGNVANEAARNTHRDIGGHLFLSLMRGLGQIRQVIELAEQLCDCSSCDKQDCPNRKTEG